MESSLKKILLTNLCDEIQKDTHQTGITRIVISKEEIGYNTIDRRDEVAKQQIFRPELADRLKPVFLIRDPFALRVSLTKSTDYRKRFLVDINLYLDAYKNLYEHFKNARQETNDAFPISIEYLGLTQYNAELALRKICWMWDIDFNYQMLCPIWIRGVEKLAYTRKYEVEYVFRQNKTGLHDNAMKNEGFNSPQMYENQLPEKEKELIRVKLLPLYNQMISIMRDDISLFQKQNDELMEVCDK